MNTPNQEPQFTPEAQVNHEQLEMAGRGALIATDLISELAALSMDATNVTESHDPVTNSLRAMSVEGIDMLQRRINAFANSLMDDPEGADPRIVKLFAGVIEGSASVANMSENGEYDEFGFDKDGVHKNGTRYDAEGYDAYGYDKNGLDEDGADESGNDPDFDWQAYEDKQAAAQEAAEEARRYSEHSTDDDYDY